MIKLSPRIILTAVLSVSAGLVNVTAYAGQDADVTQAEQQVVPTNPIPVADEISNEMLAAMKRDHITKSSPREKMYQIVHEVLLPFADLPLMARLALGRDAWMHAAESERTAFIDAFTQLMIHTYAAGMSSYVSQKFEPIRGGLQPGMTRVEIKGMITRNDGPPVPVIYRLIYEKGPSGHKEWLVYDFSVEGISMIQSFRSQFAAKISSGISVAALTQELIHHNQTGGKDND